jgi:glycosyltransferase involved in cell wall biosynthesis
MLTVLMATHNGAGTLPRVLDAYRRLQTPPGGYTLIIVDNASTDATAEVLGAAKDLPLKVLRFAERGKNRALNFALPQVLGDLVVLTDDDTLPMDDWLCQLSAAARAQPGYDLFGGRILPDWPEPCPEWILRLVNLGATYSVTPEGLQTGPIPADQIWGPNMAVRTKVFEAGHRFNEAVGPAAGQYIMGSETEFSGRVEKAGHKAWFVAEAVVEHIIRPHQMEADWIVQRAYRLGRGWYRHERTLFKPDTPLVRGVPRWKYREWVGHWLDLARGRLAGNFERSFTARWNLSLMRGYFDEAARCRAEQTVA